MGTQDSKVTPRAPGSESSDSATLTPASTPKTTSHATPNIPLADAQSQSTMGDETKDQEAAASDRQDREEQSTPEAKQEPPKSTKSSTKKNPKCKKHVKEEAKHPKKSRSKKPRADESDSDSEDSSSSDSDDSDSSDSSSEEEARKKRKGKSHKGKDKKGRRKSKKVVEESEEESASEEASGEESGDEGDGLAASPDVVKMAMLQQQMTVLKQQILNAAKPKQAKRTKPPAKTKGKGKKSSKGGFSTKFKRVDQLWDSTIHNYKLRESAEEDDSEFAEFAFLVKRKFDWENKYRDTVVEIKSKVLRAALSDVMKDCKSVSLEAEEPTIDPKILFLYLEELRTHYKKTLKAKIKSERKRKVAKKLEQQRQLLKALVGYIDEDFADTKKTLYPLLEAGKITFDLCWALFHPNDVAVTSCYGSWEEPRCFKVEYATKLASMTRGEWFCIEGRYVEYDGKGFGYGDFEVDIDAFQGPRSITSLATYPLKYHADPEGVSKKIIERGEKFIGLEGMHFMFHKGMAFHKKKKQVLKININGRVMVDPTSFRRINPNYPISQVMKRKDDEDLFSIRADDSDSDECCCGSDSDDNGTLGNDRGLDKGLDENSSAPKYKYRWTENSRGQTTFVRVEVDADGDPIPQERVDKMSATTDGHTFSKDELLLTSPVVLGFAFSEKLWLEFTITGIKPIEYNEGAFDSLVLPPNTKSIVRALVESHKSHGTKTIDDVVQGKGKGLVSVLHGPPGTGKTLTAESISELLKCPLYMVSAGELGTDPGRLEAQLQQVLDMAHSWGAILLLDEADVFLEQRETHDIHRNALVSIFLRLLEYFQGILFLTTNRVQTFDQAFQSRIHVALRYEELTTKAKRKVWEMFLDMTRKVEGMEVGEITDSDLDALSRHALNGRQIKNLVRTAQALALNEKQKLTMSHVKRALDVAETFDRDFKGGSGYLDAMRSYT